MYISTPKYRYFSSLILGFKHEIKIAFGRRRIDASLVAANQPILFVQNPHRRFLQHFSIDRQYFAIRKFHG
jgi:hypothetical protein